ncbi:vegetative cell wall protein gp1 [Triticum aestivum]|uniref:vegetative cell wall protein gp1 n=1 Tax=Triticum aestivum TaxID=4565 RepID=UPI001D00E576|nr:vegetative cell wall protein gp1-like [Triticum aestivum]XP_044356224.1 vegetative cell wall protein gp1-like [Triticum aestivum]
MHTRTRGLAFYPYEYDAAAAAAARDLSGHPLISTSIAPPHLLPRPAPPHRALPAPCPPSSHVAGPPPLFAARRRTVYRRRALPPPTPSARLLLPQVPSHPRPTTAGDPRRPSTAGAARRSGDGSPRLCHHGAIGTPPRCFHLHIDFPNPAGFASSHFFPAHSARRRTHPLISTTPTPNDDAIHVGRGGGRSIASTHAKSKLQFTLEYAVQEKTHRIQFESVQTASRHCW